MTWMAHAAVWVGVIAAAQNTPATVSGDAGVGQRPPYRMPWCMAGHWFDLREDACRESEKLCKRAVWVRTFAADGEVLDVYAWLRKDNDHWVSDPSRVVASAFAFEQRDRRYAIILNGKETIFYCTGPLDTWVRFDGDGLKVSSHELQKAAAPILWEHLKRNQIDIYGLPTKG